MLTRSVLLGILIAALGIFMILYPMATATVTTLFVGWSLIFAGVAQFVFAIQSRGAGHTVLKIVTSLLNVVTGGVLVFYPIAGVAALTLFLGSVLLVQGALMTTTAFMLRPAPGWGWFLADAVALVAVAILILAGWPSSSSWAIGTLVGVSVLMSGVSRIFVATLIRRGVGNLQNAARGAV